MNDRTDAILASIDGALADEELRDGMRWSPEPHTVTDAPEPFDGTLVWQPEQTYEPDPSAPRGRSWNGTPTEWEVNRLPAPQREPEPDPRPLCTTSLDTTQPRMIPGGWVLLAQLRADRRELLAERARLIGDGVPASALVEPLEPVHLIREEFRVTQSDLHGVADRILADARAMTPHMPVLLRPPLIVTVRQADTGLRVVGRIPPEEAADFLARIWDGLVEAVRPAVEEIGRMLTSAVRAFADATPAPPPVEDPRALVLAAARSRGTGPTLLGPERSRRPRTHQ